eukprot:2219874-Prymnesium_polylepis.1
MSNPSVVCVSGNIMTPALQTSWSRLPLHNALTCAPAAATESNLDKSQSTCVTEPPFSHDASSSSMARLDRPEGRFSAKTLAPLRTASFAVMYPVPDVVPVITSVLPAIAGKPERKSSKALLYVPAISSLDEDMPFEFTESLVHRWMPQTPPLSFTQQVFFRLHCKSVTLLYVYALK